MQNKWKVCRGHFCFWPYSGMWPKINHILTPPLMPRWEGGSCHCDLILTPKSAIFDPPCTREKDGRGQSGPNSCFPIDIVFIWGVQEFPRWFQGPWMTLPLLPDFDLKISHIWPPREHKGRMAHKSFRVLRCMWKEPAPLAVFGPKIH